MEKKIKYKILYANLADVESITANTINLKAGASLSTLPIYISSLQQVLKESPHGDFVEQSLSLQDVVSAETLNSLKSALIFKLTLFDDTVFIWGSLNNPVHLISASLSDGKTNFTLSRKTIDFE